MPATPKIQFTKNAAWKVNIRLKWGTFLSEDSDTIASVAWTIPSSLTGTGQANTTTETSIFLAGGSSGTNYDVVCTITTAAGQIFDQTVTIKVL